MRGAVLVCLPPISARGKVITPDLTTVTGYIYTAQVSEHVSFIYADQTYRVRGKSGSAERVEYIDADNLPLNIERAVICNRVHIPEPISVVPQLCDPRVLADIRANGVYRQPFTGVLPRMSEITVKHNLLVWSTEVMALVQQVAAANGTSVTQLDAEAIARAMVGRSQMDPGGPTYFKVLRSVQECSTQSYEDGYKILGSNHVDIGTFPVERVGGDGQLVLLLSYLKRKFPDRYKNVLIDSGDFHMFAHLMFALHELWWRAIVWRCIEEVRLIIYFNLFISLMTTINYLTINYSIY